MTDFHREFDILFRYLSVCLSVSHILICRHSFPERCMDTRARQVAYLHKMIDCVHFVKRVTLVTLARLKVSDVRISDNTALSHR